VVAPPTNTDLFTNGWATRYLYDLTASVGSASVNFQGRTGLFNAYGNLYDTQELLPSAANDTLSWGSIATQAVSSPSPLATATPIANNVFADITATSFDALDRPTNKFRIVYSNSAEKLATEALTYDQTPDSQGLPYSDCAQEVSECKSYTYDALGRPITDSFTPNTFTPNRTISYDSDGRPSRISQAGTNGDTRNYTYDLDGRLTVVNPNTENTMYHYYPDGQRKSVGSSTSPFTTEVLTYSYAPDGSLQYLGMHLPYQGGPYGHMAYTLTNAGRISERDDTYNQKGPMKNSFLYSAGLRTSQSFFGGGTQTAMQYSAEGELLGQFVTAPKAGSMGTLQHVNEAWYYNARGEVTDRFDHLGQTKSRYANGVNIVTYPLPQTVPPTTPEGASALWDARAGASLGSAYASQTTDIHGFATLMAQTSQIGFDRTGRNVSSAYTGSCATLNPNGCSGSDPGAQTLRAYDVENHVISSSATYTSFANGNPGPYGSPIATVYTLGADGHPTSIATTNGGSSGTENLFWDGNSLLYSKRAGAVDDVKIGANAEYTPNDPGYKGVTFYDRGIDGSVAFCHNESTIGTGSGGWGDGNSNLTINKFWGNIGPSNPCGPPLTIPGWGMQQYPLSVAWDGSYNSMPTGTGVGMGWTIGQPRADGITDEVSTIQGARSYDAVSSQWTTPDAYPGEVDDPMTQKAYTWDGNNPVSNSDPNGYYASVFFDWDEGSGSGDAHADIDTPWEQEADKALVARGDLKDFWTVEDAAYGAAIAYGPAAAADDREGAESQTGIPEVGAGLYGTQLGHISVGALLYGYYDKDTGTPTVNIALTSDLLGLWHAHPGGGTTAELYGHIQNLKSSPGLQRIYTTVGKSLYLQYIAHGAVFPPLSTIQPLCKNCLP
jgi:hypothetical protein